MSSRKPQVPALHRMLDILNFVAQNPHCSFTSIHTRLALPKSSAYILINEMRALGLLRGEPRGGIALGLQLMEWGQLAAGQLSIRTETLPFLRELAEQVGLTCHLGVFDGTEAFYLAKVESRQAKVITSWEGKRLSLYCSAVGKTLLAFMDEPARSTIMDQLELVGHTPNTIVDKATLVQHFNATVLRGWAVDDEEDVADLRCVAAPVHDISGQVVASISAVGTISQVPVERLPLLAAEVMHCAGLISATLGYKSRSC